MSKDFNEFQKNISYEFKDKELMETALTHSSYTNEHRDSKSYQRLEFLGDTVLEIVVSTEIYKMFPDFDEGDMSKLRAEMVREESLANFGRQLKINNFINLGKSEVLVHGYEKDSIISDCFESVLGAIYLDSDFETAKKWLNSIITENCYKHFNHVHSDSKSELQELVKKDGGQISYRLVSASGPEHNKTFKMEVLINGNIMATGTAASKKKAEQNAAQKALKKMRG